MSRYKPGDKDKTRARILKEASRLFRREGAESTSVADVMEAADLTVGGFYKHFESKEELFSEAVGEALTSSRKLTKEIDPSIRGEDWQHLVSKIYLTPAHRDNVARGCALPALSGDIARADQSAKEVFEAGLEKYIQGTADRLDGTPEENRQQAWAFWASLVGGLLLSRSVASDTLSREILEACSAAFETQDRENEA
ncbi:MAG: TetR family transcriptional regulator [Candidatus Hydrogenedentota bacterium]|nr:MAG: TetR family transcriptional regulator [Candidatus Hydrogenedentota bacterium]